MIPRFLNSHATDPVAPMWPPNFSNPWRTSPTVRWRLSVMHSTTSATPAGPYPS